MSVLNKAFKSDIRYLTLSMLALGIIIPQAVYGQTRYTIDVSGAGGLNGKDGYSYSTSPGSSGGDGQDGGDATQSTPGKSAGNITVQLKDLAPLEAPVVGEILITGTANRNSVNQSIQFVPSAKIVLKAKGGDGGNGGDGGDGQGGCNGRDGRDASEYSDGTNGTDGCDGGDGGNATPGADAGNGGNIDVILSRDDLHLSLMVEASVEKGLGGSGGDNGRGGQGGYGGDGGSSYSWSETVHTGSHQECRTVYESVPNTVCETDSVSDGSGGFEAVTSCHTEYETETSTECETIQDYRTDHYSNSGGYDGRNGSAGRPGFGNTSDGTDGTNGRFRFIVRDNKGVEQVYTRPFNLLLSSYKFKDQDENGIFEPGEKVSVYDIVVRNAAKMPTPGKKAKVMMFLNNSSWVTAAPQALEIEQLAGESEAKVPGTLEFTIKNNRLPVSNTRAQTSDTIVPMAQISRIEYNLNQFELPKTFSITYPVEIQAFVTKASLGIGESAPIVWKIKNISGRAIGLTSDLQRALSVTLQRQGGDAANTAFEFVTPKGDVINTGDTMKAAWQQEIPVLEAGETMMIEGQIRVKEDAVALTRGSFGTNLNLGNIATQEAQTIQALSVEVRIAQTFKHHKDSEMLLVINENTRLEEVQAWKELTQKFGIKIDIWDFSYYGFLSLTRDLEMNEGKSLVSTYIGRSIVLLDNARMNNAGNIRDYITKQDFLNAASTNGVNFLVLGSDRKQLQDFIASRLLPERVSANNPSQNEDQYIKELIRAQKDSLDDLGLRVDYNGKKMEQIQLEALLMKRAKKFKERLDKMNLGENYYVTYNLDPHTETVNGKSTNVLGELFIISTLQYNDGKLVGYEVPEQKSSDPEFIQSDEMFRILFLSMGMDQKLRVLKLRTTAWSDKQSQWLTGSIIHELIDEMDAKNPKLKFEQQRFSSLIKLQNAFNTPNSRSLDNSVMQWIEIFAAATFYERQISNAWRGKAFWTSAYETAIKEMLNKLGYSKANELYNSRIKDLETRLRARNKVLIGRKGLDNARRMFVMPMLFRASRSLEVIKKTSAQPFSVEWNTTTQEGF